MVCPLLGHLTTGLGRFQPSHTPLAPGGWAAVPGSLVCLGLGPPGARGLRVRCPGPTPALPVLVAGRFVGKDGENSETGRGQVPGRGHSWGVQALLSGWQSPRTRHCHCSQRSPRDGAVGVLGRDERFHSVNELCDGTPCGVRSVQLTRWDLFMLQEVPRPASCWGHCRGQTQGVTVMSPPIELCQRRVRESTDRLKMPQSVWPCTWAEPTQEKGRGSVCR